MHAQGHLTVGGPGVESQYAVEFIHLCQSAAQALKVNIGYSPLPTNHQHSLAQLCLPGLPGQNAPVATTEYAPNRRMLLQCPRREVQSVEHMSNIAKHNLACAVNNQHSLDEAAFGLGIWPH